jgi:hypothetical protein
MDRTILVRPPANAAGIVAEQDEFVDSSQAAALIDRGDGLVYPARSTGSLSKRPEYDADAAELAYTRTVGFLRRALA